ncbi:hormogonium polysaccharide biosynthesis acetyltransferase HpsU [Nodosilinea sp. PGN35]|uniref:hormogonium polysaccharide biosynthesis acetyltransferase HpsU n=1 Tax=Nodosilinea sp. PGN35 TaxID=3020489 RepID=UPI0023B288C5|nr:hormogonium polysaccharide biosynthesis acetyltransferase HpsU [Nodosilinea sp. TSF1-S3]MDF0368216.1 hormogonium polysaccharide biosynthesis acetyltransferase HpsU [Nodosilinea sp. TSF1-S3]
MTVSSPSDNIHAPGDDRPWVRLDTYDQSWYQPGRSKGVILLWWLLQAVVFPLTPHASHGPRRWLLRQFGATVGRGVVIRPTARFTYPWNVTIGDHSWIGDDVVLYSLAPITIGQHCVISQKSYLCTGSHDIRDPRFGLLVAPVVIENGAWVATDCFVAPGVTVGANSVVGARSSVFKSLPSGQICLGNPCRAVAPRQMGNG